jgi:galactosyl transferase GMA12/MNN10 family
MEKPPGKSNLTFKVQNSIFNYKFWIRQVLEMRSNVLMFSVSLNGYDLIYKKCVDSHKRYAEQHGYEYILVNRPPWVSFGNENKWLKIPLIIEALRKQYEWVFFIDSDCEIQADAPTLASIAAPGKSLYLANGWSGRVNSGVIIVKNTPETQQFFEQILDAAEVPVPLEDHVADGENGHIIHYSKDQEFLQLLDRRWNNNVDVTLDDYIRHYTGAMRKFYQRDAIGKLLKTQAKLMKMVQGWLGKNRQSALLAQPSLKTRLQKLLVLCQAEYPAFKN